MGAGISAGRHLRVVAVAWLPPVRSVAGNGLLVGGIAALGSICAIACRQYRRINLGVAICWSRRFRFLPQPLVHQVVVVGGGLPCRVGLGPILLSRNFFTFVPGCSGGLFWLPSFERM